MSSSDESTSNHDLQQPTDGTTSTNNNYTSNYLQQKEVTPSPSAKDMEQQHINNISNLRSIALQSPEERGFTEFLGLIILESIVMNKRGILTYTNVNNMTLDIDDNQITGLDEPSIVFGGGTKDFLEEVFVHVISDEGLVLEFLGGNEEAFQILNHLMDINYDWKNREMAHVMFYEVDIARDIIYDTLDIDDGASLMKSPTLPTYQQPTLLSSITTTIGIKRAALHESALEGIELVTRSTKRLKPNETEELVTRPTKRKKLAEVVTDLVTYPAKKLKGAVVDIILVPLAKSLLNGEITQLQNNVEHLRRANDRLVEEKEEVVDDTNFALTNQGFDIDRLSREKDAAETRMNKLLSEEEEMNDVLAHQLMVQEGKNEALAGQLEARVQEVEHQKRKSAGAQYKVALERQRLTNELTTARGEADSARRHNEALAEELVDTEMLLTMERYDSSQQVSTLSSEAHSARQRISSLEAQLPSTMEARRVQELEARVRTVETELATARGEAVSFSIVTSNFDPTLCNSLYTFFFRIRPRRIVQPS